MTRQSSGGGPKALFGETLLDSPTDQCGDGRTGRYGMVENTTWSWEVQLDQV